MASVFSKIIAGELPARFVYDDPVCVAFLSINPLKPGHTLVVPRQEVEHWIDLDADTWGHLSAVSQHIGSALEQAYRPEKVGMMLAGLEVPHVHVHLVPIWNVHDLDFARAEAAPAEDALDAAQRTVRAAIEHLGGSGLPPSALR